MCYNPVQLINPKLKTDNFDSQFNLASDRLYVQVPCGHCGECLDQKMKNYIVRTYYQYIDTVEKKGGFCFFQTYTFSEENVTKFHGLTCFDSHKYRRFSKNLRNLLRNRFGSDSYGKLKTFFVSEYGGETARAHHHALHFVEIPGCTPEIFNECVNKAWDYGMTQTNNPYKSHGKPNEYYNRPDLCVVTRHDAIIYVSKYTNKDFDFLVILNKLPKDHEFVQWFQHRRYLKYLCESLSYVPVEDPSEVLDIIPDDDTSLLTEIQFNMFYPFKKVSYQDIYQVLDRSDFNRFMPFNRLSQAFGISLCDEDLETLMKGRVLLPDNDKGVLEYKLPMYIDRKLFYDYDPTTKLFTLNELGKKMKVVRTEINSDYVVNQMSGFFSTWYLNLRPEVKDNIFNSLQLRVNSSLETPDDVSDFVSDCLDGRDWTDYVNYILVYKNMLLPKENVLYFDNAVSANYDLVHNRNVDDYLDKNKVPYGDKKLFHHFVSDMSCNLCNDHYEFRGFEKISETYEIIRHYLSSEQQFEYMNNLRLKSVQKMFNIEYKGKL